MRILGAVLAGGLNTRYPSPKALIEIGGMTIMARTLEVLRPRVSELAISTNEPGLYYALGVPMLGDVVPRLGPISGIITVLYHARRAGCEAVLCVACDMPFLSGALMDYIISRGGEREAVVPVWKGEPEPLIALYGVGALGGFERLHAEGRGSMRRALERLDTLYIDGHEVGRLDPGGRSFININSPGDYEAAISGPHSDA